MIKMRKREMHENLVTWKPGEEERLLVKKNIKEEEWSTLSNESEVS